MLGTLPWRGTVAHPGFGGMALNYELTSVPEDPDDQVGATISLMSHYAATDAAHPAILTDARRALAEASPGATPEQAVFQFVRRRVRFVDDEVNAAPLAVRTNIPIVEVLIRPVDMSQMCSGGGCQRTGDCDDHAMYGAALLKALGRTVKFVTVAADGADPSRYSHVYLVSYPPEQPGARVALDLSHGAACGWEVPNRYGKRREWSVGSDLRQIVLNVAGAAAAWLIYKEWQRRKAA
jgi:transglutaminase-like putative cysteine protease